MGPTDADISHKEGVAIIPITCLIDTDAAPQLEKELMTPTGEERQKNSSEFFHCDFIGSGGMRLLIST